MPDLVNDRLLVYNTSAPDGFGMIEVPLANPKDAGGRRLHVGAFATGGGRPDWAVQARCCG